MPRKPQAAHQAAASAATNAAAVGLSSRIWSKAFCRLIVQLADKCPTAPAGPREDQGQRIESQGSG
jgi:hypothetical protein